MDKLEQTLASVANSPPPLPDLSREAPSEQEWARQSSKLLIAAAEHLNHAQQMDGLKAFLRTVLRSSTPS
eukprot:7972323-Pyramimonas_sp.AAC.1